MIIPLFGTGIQSKSRVVTAQRRLNCFYEIVPDGDKTKVAIYGTPGMTLWITLDYFPVRGAVTIAVGNNSFAYVVAGTKLLKITAITGVVAVLGTLNSSTGSVDMAFDETTLLIVDGTNGYNLTLASDTFSQVTSAGFPNGATTCTWLVGYFVAAYGNQFWISEDGITWDALDVATASAAPDGIRRVVSQASQLVIFGTLTVEFWDVIASDFPFSQVGSSTLEMGLFSAFSAVKTSVGTFLLGRLNTGQARVVLQQGFQAQPISTQDLETLINAYDTITDATGLSYVYQGHLFYQLNFPSANKSWLYDMSTQLWSEKAYGLDEQRDRAQFFFRLQNNTYLTDFETGDIYLQDSSVFTDNGTPIARELIGKHFFNDFNRVVVDKFQLDMETGVGLQSGQGSDPQIMLQVSRDGGRTFGNEIWTALGAIGKYITQVDWKRLGVARDWAFKVRMTDPVKFVVALASITARKGT